MAKEGGEMPIPLKEHEDFTYERAERVARGPGVYQLSDRAYEIVLIGTSTFLPDKILDHLREKSPLTMKVRRFWAEQTDNYKEREQELLEEFKQAHNGELPEGNR